MCLLVDVRSQQVRCGLVGEVPSCGAPCYKVKLCGKHRCLLTCHNGEWSLCCAVGEAGYVHAALCMLLAVCSVCTTCRSC